VRLATRNRRIREFPSLPRPAAGRGREGTRGTIVSGRRTHSSSTQGRRGSHFVIKNASGDRKHDEDNFASHFPDEKLVKNKGPAVLV